MITGVIINVPLMIWLLIERDPRRRSRTSEFGGQADLSVTGRHLRWSTEGKEIRWLRRSACSHRQALRNCHSDIRKCIEIQLNPGYNWLYTLIKSLNDGYNNESMFCDFFLRLPVILVTISWQRKHSWKWRSKAKTEDGKWLPQTPISPPRNHSNKLTICPHFLQLKLQLIMHRLLKVFLAPNEDCPEWGARSLDDTRRHCWWTVPHLSLWLP